MNTKAINTIFIVTIFSAFSFLPGKKVEPTFYTATDKSLSASSLELIGTWVHVGANRTFAAPVCCGWDANNFAKKTAQCGSEPLQHRAVYSGRSDGLFQQMGGHACQCRKDFRDEYEWQAPNLPVFDALQTCQQLQLQGKNRTVLILGDSTLSQTATTLMNALIPGGCSPQVKFIQADTLIHQPMGVLNRGRHWKTTVEEEQPDIAILGAGAHIRAEENYTLVVDEVLEDMHKMLTELPNTTIVWKTQQPAGCTHDIFYPNNPLRAAQDFNFSKPAGYKKYQHEMFYHRDLYTIGKLQALGLPYLDMRMLYSRSDAHISSGKEVVSYDCLHMCSPGPLDIVAPLFQRLLLEIDHLVPSQY